MPNNVHIYIYICPSCNMLGRPIRNSSSAVCKPIRNWCCFGGRGWITRFSCSRYPLK